MSLAPVIAPVGPPPPPTSPPLPPLARFNLLLLGGLFVALTLLLWPHWQSNPDLSHGFLAPVIFLLLLHEARSGTPRYLHSTVTTRLAQGGLLGFGLLMLCAAGLYAAALDWSHALVAFLLTMAFAFLLGGALVGFASTRLRAMPFNWSAVVAIGLWCLSAPIPPGSSSRLTLGLQLAVTEYVLRALHLLGIAAERHGNIIELATTSVGVEEACSGIRSLISCVFAGLFFSATLVRRAWARALIIGLAAPIAIAMNFVRSLTLTLLANSGVDISGRWHDVTGYAVLAITAALLAGLALLLEAHAKRHPRPAVAAEPAAPAEFFASFSRLLRRRPGIPGAMLQAPLTVALLLSVLLVGFFFANTRPSPRHNLPVPDLLALLPAESAGWQVHTSDDLFQFSATLHTEHLAQRTYARINEGTPEQITIYLAYWRAGQAAVSLVASHTPDACWPGSGWTPVRRHQAPLEQFAVAGQPVPAPESRLFLSGRLPQHVWFWHLYDGRPIAYRDPYSARELLNIAWHYGFSHDGDQLFVRISSNRPWEEIADEPLLAEVFSHLAGLGLR